MYDILITSSCIILMLFGSSRALDLEGAKESTCFDVSETVPQDLNWVLSRRTTYYPVMSRLLLYHLGARVSHTKAVDLLEDELYYESCLRLELEGGNYIATGYNGSTAKLVFKPVKGREVFAEYDITGEIMLATCYNTLTDNKTFTFTTCCSHKSNQMIWVANSPLKRLPTDTVKKIHDHAKSLGFKPEFFTSLRYDWCKLKEENVDEKNGAFIHVTTIRELVVIIVNLIFFHNFFNYLIL